MAFGRTSTLRGRNVFVAVIALLAVQMFAIVVSGVSARDSSVAAAREGITREGQTTTQAILRHLEPAEQSVEVTSLLLRDGLLDVSEPGLERYLFTQLAVMPQVTGAFVGYPSGDFVFVAVDGDGYRTKRVTAGPERSVDEDLYDESFERTSTEELLDDDYDPRVRPWYEQAVEVDDVAWTDPYVFFSSQQPGVTVSAAVRVGGEVIAVVGVDVELSGLATFLDDLNVSEQGEAFVVSGDTVIGAPSTYTDRIGTGDDGELRLLTMSELGVPVIQRSSLTDVRRFATDEGTDLVMASEFPAGEGLGWTLVMRAPEGSFTAISEAQQRTTLLVTVGGGLLVLLGVVALVRVSRPITRMQALAATDPLTGLANRRSIDQRGSELMAEVGLDVGLSVIVLDLDGFKGLNDQFGHHIGDRALVVVGRALAELQGDDVMTGRLGGDEFVIARTVRSVDRAVVDARRVLDELRSLLAAELPNSPVGVSAGMTVGFDAGAGFAALLREADSALMSAKAGSKGMLRLVDRLATAVS